MRENTFTMPAKNEPTRRPSEDAPSFVDVLPPLPAPRFLRRSTAGISLNAGLGYNMLYRQGYHITNKP